MRSVTKILFFHVTFNHIFILSLLQILVLKHIKQMSKFNPTVSVDWLKNNINSSNLVLLEASLPVAGANSKQTQYTDIQIKGSINFDLKNVFRDKYNSLPNTIPSPELFSEGCQNLGINQDSQIIIYDNIGVYSSPRAWWLFKVMGHENVAILDGGLPAWVTEKLETEPKKQPAISKKGDFVAKYQPNLVQNAKGVFQNLENSEIAILDARSAKRFSGNTPEPREGLRSGHIPNSVNLPYSEVLKDGKFKSQDELKSIFSELKIEDKSLIFSCGSGITACIILMASELISDNTKALYDGSWTEWGQSKYPISTL